MFWVWSPLPSFVTVDCKRSAGGGSGGIKATTTTSAVTSLCGAQGLGITLGMIRCMKPLYIRCCHAVLYLFSKLCTCMCGQPIAAG